MRVCVCVSVCVCITTAHVGSRGKKGGDVLLVTFKASEVVYVSVFAVCITAARVYAL